MLEQVGRELTNHHSFVVVSHVAPDGDSLGSILGLCMLLRSHGKTATAVCLDTIPEKFMFLPGITDMVTCSDSLPESAECLIVLDCGEITRTGVPQSYAECRALVNIDHHRSNQGNLGLAWVNEEYAATGEQVWALAKHMGWPLSHDVATCLYTALATDTGFFRFSNTNARVLRTAADLVELGVDIRLVAEQTLERRTLPEICVIRESLSTLTQYFGGRVSALEITRANCERCGVLPEDTEGLIEYPRGIPGTEVALLFREVASDLVRVSLRSRRSVDVSRVASDLGGGGHARAAGCTMAVPLHVAKQEVLERVSKEFPEDV